MLRSNAQYNSLAPSPTEVDRKQEIAGLGESKRSDLGHAGLARMEPTTTPASRSQFSYFAELPAILKRSIYGFVTPVSHLALVNKEGQTIKLTPQKEDWKNNFRAHFPHLYKSISRKKNIDWQAEFKISSSKEYAKLSPRLRALLVAIKERNIARIEEMEFKFTELTEEDSNGRTLLDWIQKIKDKQVLDCFDKIAAKKCEHLAPGSVRRTRSFWAIQFLQDRDKIDALLSLEDKLCNEIHAAVATGNYELTVALLEKNPELYKAKDHNHLTPLMHAARNGHTKILKYLLLLDNSIEYIDTKANGSGLLSNNRLNALDLALLKGHTRAAFTLMNAHPQSGPLNNRRLLMFKSACMFGNFAMVRHIFKKATIEDKTRLITHVFRVGNLQRSSFVLAVTFGKTKIVKYLTKAFKKLNIDMTVALNAQNSGTLALHCAINDRYNKITCTLIEAGARLDACVTVSDVKGVSILHRACRIGNLVVVKAILKKNADAKEPNILLELRDGLNYTPLLKAAASRNTHIALALIKKGAALDFKGGPHGCTPLQIACKMVMSY